ncbi:hypothetical protein ADUPG1_000060 [Aduncisulcus paluster]|uniref:Uncharacterized protein n=1 Tax=Aduncisulcus paluster TaxID=2918883 RepID=A0ABQ5K839_9EUKA|nr:hypothetical protein ADUPG1_000060 [Aduncisulcus paluster]
MKHMIGLSEAPSLATSIRYSSFAVQSTKAATQKQKQGEAILNNLASSVIGGKSKSRALGAKLKPMTHAISSKSERSGVPSSKGRAIPHQDSVVHIQLPDKAASGTNPSHKTEIPAFSRAVVLAILEALKEAVGYPEHPQKTENDGTSVLERGTKLHVAADLALSDLSLVLQQNCSELGDLLQFIRTSVSRGSADLRTAIFMLGVRASQFEAALIAERKAHSNTQREAHLQLSKQLKVQKKALAEARNSVQKALESAAQSVSKEKALRLKADQNIVLLRRTVETIRREVVSSDASALKRRVKTLEMTTADRENEIRSLHSQLMNAQGTIEKQKKFIQKQKEEIHRLRHLLDEEASQRGVCLSCQEKITEGARVGGQEMWRKLQSVQQLMKILRDEEDEEEEEGEEEEEEEDKEYSEYSYTEEEEEDQVPKSPSRGSKRWKEDLSASRRSHRHRHAHRHRRGSEPSIIPQATLLAKRLKRLEKSANDIPEINKVMQDLRNANQRVEQLEDVEQALDRQKTLDRHLLSQLDQLREENTQLHTQVIKLRSRDALLLTTLSSDEGLVSQGYVTLQALEGAVGIVLAQPLPHFGLTLLPPCLPVMEDIWSETSMPSASTTARSVGGAGKKSERRTSLLHFETTISEDTGVVTSSGKSLNSADAMLPPLADIISLLFNIIRGFIAHTFTHVDNIGSNGIMDITEAVFPGGVLGGCAFSGKMEELSAFAWYFLYKSYGKEAMASARASSRSVSSSFDGDLADLIYGILLRAITHYRTESYEVRYIGGLIEGRYSEESVIVFCYAILLSFGGLPPCAPIPPVSQLLPRPKKHLDISSTYGSMTTPREAEVPSSSITMSHARSVVSAVLAGVPHSVCEAVSQHILAQTEVAAAVHSGNVDVCLLCGLLLTVYDREMTNRMAALRVAYAGVCMENESDSSSRRGKEGRIRESRGNMGVGGMDDTKTISRPLTSSISQMTTLSSSFSHILPFLQLMCPGCSRYSAAMVWRKAVWMSGCGYKKMPKFDALVWCMRERGLLLSHFSFYSTKTSISWSVRGKGLSLSSMDRHVTQHSIQVDSVASIKAAITPSVEKAIRYLERVLPLWGSESRRLGQLLGSKAQLPEIIFEDTAQMSARSKEHRSARGGRSRTKPQSTMGMRISDSGRSETRGSALAEADCLTSYLFTLCQRVWIASSFTNTDRNLDLKGIAKCLDAVLSIVDDKKK